MTRLDFRVHVRRPGGGVLVGNRVDVDPVAISRTRETFAFQEFSRYSFSRAREIFERAGKLLSLVNEILPLFKHQGRKPM